MKNKVKSILFLFSFSQSDAVEIGYKFSGLINNSSKFGLNINQSATKVDRSNGILPTESLSTLKADIDFLFHLTHQDHVFNIALGGSIGGYVYDSTRNLKSGSEIYRYFGYYEGITTTNGTGNKYLRNYILYNANLFYSFNRYFSLQIGRFAADTGDWLKAYIQGIRIKTQVIPYTTLWFYTTRTRGNHGGYWLKDFRYMNVTGNKNAWDYAKGFYFYNGGIDFKYKNYSFHPQFYAQDSRFIAPNLNFSYTLDPNFKNQGFNFQIQVISLFMYYLDGAIHKTSGSNNYKNVNQTIGRGGVSLFIKPTLFYNNYDFGGAIYKNFDNPNEFLGSWGDPTGFGNWTGSVYEFTSWNNVFRRDAISGFIFIGGKHGVISWKLTGRYTDAPRAQEQSVIYSLTYQPLKKVKINFTLEYYGNITKTGYRLGRKILTHDTYSDRSSIRTALVYAF